MLNLEGCSNFFFLLLSVTTKGSLIILFTTGPFTYTARPEKMSSRFFTSDCFFFFLGACEKIKTSQKFSIINYVFSNPFIIFPILLLLPNPSIYFFNFIYCGAAWLSLLKITNLADIMLSFYHSVTSKLITASLSFCHG